MEDFGVDKTVKNLRLAQLFADEITPEAPRDEQAIIVRRDKRKTISFPDPLYSCQMLTPDLQGAIEFVIENKSERVARYISAITPPSF